MRAALQASASRPRRRPTDSGSGPGLPRSLAAAATAHQPVSRLPRRPAGRGLTPSPSPGAPDNLLPHRLHRASAAPQAWPLLSTCPKQDAAASIVAASNVRPAPRAVPASLAAVANHRRRRLQGANRRRGSSSPPSSQPGAAGCGKRFFCFTPWSVRDKAAWPSGSVS